MHAALLERRAAGEDGERAHDGGDREQDDLRRAEAEHERAVEPDRRDRDRRDREADRGHRGAEREVEARLHAVARGVADGGSVSGSRTSSAITTPTADGGAPIAATASSIAGDSSLARPRRPRARPAAGRGSSAPRGRGRVGVRPPGRASSARAGSSRGGGRSGPPRTGRRARARRPRRTRAAPTRTPAPGALGVNVGRTRHTTASVQTVASAVAVPSALNDAVPSAARRPAARSRRSPLQVIITAAKTVSRASVAVPGRPRPSASRSARPR